MILDRKQLQNLEIIAKSAAIEAGEYIQSQFNKNYQTQSKVGGDSLASQVVTEVDFKAQEIILKHLNPTINELDLGLLTEESTDNNSRLIKDYFWCIDPMDGTLPFTEKRTGYAVSIALVNQAGDPVIGVVYIPDLNECYTSVKGEGVSMNGHQLLKDSNPSRELNWYMDQSLRSEVYFDQVTKRLQNESSMYGINSISQHDKFGGVRNAIGVLNSDIGMYFKLPKQTKGCGSIWDYAATRLFFEEMGLYVSDAKGNRLHLNNPRSTFMNEGGIFYATNQFLTELFNRIK